MTNFLGRAVGECAKCQRLIMINTGIATQAVRVKCECGKAVVRCQPMYGSFSDGTRACDFRCVFARGPNCDCACGGQNHGQGNAADFLGLAGEEG